jgi:hypothetical protein
MEGNENPAFNSDDDKSQFPQVSLMIIFWYLGSTYNSRRIKKSFPKDLCQCLNQFNLLMYLTKCSLNCLSCVV